MLRKLLGKSGILAMVVVLVLGGQVVLGAEVKIADVPESHWAYQGVKKLVQEGYMGVFEDGTFQGQRPVDRYTLASVVGTMLLEIEKGQLGVTQADLELLRKLSTEFRDELVRWYNESEQLRTTVADTQKRVQVMDDTITRVIDTMEQEDAATRKAMQEQVTLILEEIARTKTELTAADAAIGERITTAEQELAAQGAQIKSTEIALAETSAAVEGNTAVIKEHTRWLALQGESLNALEDAIGVKVQSRFAEREAALSLLQSDLEARDEELEAELRQVETDLAHATAQILEVESKLGDWQKASTQRDGELRIRVEGLEAGVNELSQALKTEQVTVDDLSKDIETLQEQLARQAEAMAAADGQLMKDVNTLRQDLVRSLEAVQVDLVNISDRIVALDKRTAILQQGTATDSKDLADLKGFVGELHDEFVVLSDRLVATEEKLSAMDEQVTTQSSSQLSASLMREKRLERQVQELQEEFDSYRKQAEKDNKSVKGASNIATIAAVIALIVAVVVN